MPAYKNNSNATNTGLAVAGGAALAGSGGGVSTPVLTTCPPEDKTFMCKLTRFYNSFKMIFGIISTIILVLFVMWFAYTWYKARR